MPTSQMAVVTERQAILTIRSRKAAASVSDVRSGLIGIEKVLETLVEVHHELDVASHDVLGARHLSLVVLAHRRGFAARRRDQGVVKR